MLPQSVSRAFARCNGNPEITGGVSMNEKKQIPYIQWLRIFAAFAVVLMHTAGSRWPGIGHTEPRWLWLTAWDSLVRWPVPIFVMITGALFLPRKTELKTVLTRYIPRMVLAFALWSGGYALLDLYQGVSWRQAILNFVTGHYHLWYLPYLCGVYLVIPFVQKIVTDEKLEEGLLAVSLVVGIFLPWLADVLVLVFPGGSSVVRSLQNSLNFTFFMDLLALLLMGHWLHRHEIAPQTRGGLYVLGILGILVTAAATVWVSRRAGAASSVFFDMKAPNNLLAAAAIFVFAKYHLTQLPRWTVRLARWSFGVYLIHPLVIEVLAALGIHVLAWNPLWWTPVLAVAVFLISAAASALLEKIPVIGKYLT